VIYHISAEWNGFYGLLERFSVVKIKSKGFSDLVTAVGNMASVNVGAVVSLRGEWKYDSKFGRQFNVYHYEESIPATVAGIEKYLV